MARDGGRKCVKVEYEDIYSNENMDKCPGFMYVGAEVGPLKRWVEVLVRCDQFHAHQERLKVLTFDTGEKENYIVTCFKKSLKTAREVGLR